MPIDERVVLRAEIDDLTIGTVNRREVAGRGFIVWKRANAEMAELDDGVGIVALECEEAIREIAARFLSEGHDGG